MALTAASVPPIDLETRMKLKATIIWFRIKNTNELIPITGDRFYNQVVRTTVINCPLTDGEQQRIRAIESLLETHQNRDPLNGSPEPGNWRLLKDGKVVNLKSMSCEHDAIYEIDQQIKQTIEEIILPPQTAKSIARNIMVISGRRENLQTPVCEDTVIFFPKGSLIHIELHLHERYKVSKKRANIDPVQVLECMLPTSITLRQLLLAAGIAPEKFYEAHLANIAGDQSPVPVLSTPPLGKLIESMCEGKRVALTLVYTR